MNFQIIILTILITTLVYFIGRAIIEIHILVQSNMKIAHLLIAMALHLGVVEEIDNDESGEKQ